MTVCVKKTAKHYSFTEEELDFIISYDIKYRMGGILGREVGCMMDVEISECSGSYSRNKGGQYVSDHKNDC
jgi:hypothetical protein